MIRRDDIETLRRRARGATDDVPRYSEFATAERAAAARRDERLAAADAAKQQMIAELHDQHRRTIASAKARVAELQAIVDATPAGAELKALRQRLTILADLSLPDVRGVYGEHGELVAEIQADFALEIADEMRRYNIPAR